MRPDHEIVAESPPDPTVSLNRHNDDLQRINKNPRLYLQNRSGPCLSADPADCAYSVGKLWPRGVGYRHIFSVGRLEHVISFVPSVSRPGHPRSGLWLKHKSLQQFRRSIRIAKNTPLKSGGRESLNDDS